MKYVDPRWIFALGASVLILILLSASSDKRPALQLITSSRADTTTRVSIPECRKKSYHDLDCKRILDKWPDALANAEKWTPERVPESDLLEMVYGRNCPNLRENFCFPSNPLSEEEAAFPLAFVLIVHKGMDQFLRLLEAVYWPQNFYCLTYDKKADARFSELVENLVGNCGIQNLLITPTHEVIEWGRMGVLQAAVNCLKVLKEAGEKSDRPWKYVQILSGQDFPLKTNLEMVEIFQIFNGSNDAEQKPGQEYRFKYQTHYYNDTKYLPREVKMADTVVGFPGVFHFDTKQPKPPPPGHNTTVFKGSFSASMTFELVKFIVDSEVAQAYLEWSRDTIIPDEQFWSTLVHNPQLGSPGAYPGTCVGKRKRWVSRFQIWPGEGLTCHGTWVHGSCVFGVRDLEQLLEQPHLVAHKLYSDFQPAAAYCLAQWNYNKTYSKSRVCQVKPNRRRF